MFEVRFSTHNAAFADDPSEEIAGLLLKVAAAIKAGKDCGPIMDSNGNKVGSFEYSNRWYPWFYPED